MLGRTHDAAVTAVRVAPSRWCACQARICDEPSWTDDQTT